MNSTVLLIDDDPIDIKALQALLQSWGLDCLLVRSGADALSLLSTHPVDLVISDMRMPGMSGEAVVVAVRAAEPTVPVIVITAFGDVKSAVQAMKLGAFDFVVKPPDEDEFRLTVERAIEHARLQRENNFLRAELRAGGMYNERLLGRSPAMMEVFALINRVAKSDSTVLITGETGTGKELVAQTVHYRSQRSAAPFVAVNCAALNANLIESELFGHEKGAFTGAVAARRGRFEDASGGTLFLDEIGETSAEFQAKLLRVIEERSYERVGSSQTRTVDLRLIASTNRDLEAEVKQGRFREDLYYRLSVIPIHLPPLRDRKADIALLADHFLHHYRSRYHVENRVLGDDAKRYLEQQEWKGNVRELRHAIERAVVLSAESVIVAADLQRRSNRREPMATPSSALRDVLDERSREHMLAVLEQTNWHKQQAADLLEVDRATLYRLIQKYNIERE